MFYRSFYDENAKSDLLLELEAYLDQSINSLVAVFVVFYSKSNIEVTLDLVMTSMDRAIHESEEKLTRMASMAGGSELGELLASLPESARSDFRPTPQVIHLLLRDSVVVATRLFGYLPNADQDVLKMRRAFKDTLRRFTELWQKRVKQWGAQPDEFEKVRTNALRQIRPT